MKVKLQLNDGHINVRRQIRIKGKELLLNLLTRISKPPAVKMMLKSSAIHVFVFSFLWGLSTLSSSSATVYDSFSDLPSTVYDFIVVGGKVSPDRDMSTMKYSYHGQ